MRFNALNSETQNVICPPPTSFIKKTTAFLYDIECDQTNSSDDKCDHDKTSDCGLSGNGSN